jgi:hypothetical protein
MNSIQDTAASLAADLAGSRVDPNEAQKALSYLRQNKDSAQFFAYLRAISKDGRAVIRSNQTLDYYRNLLTACERHLHGMSTPEMTQTLGWAIRLLRYYKTVPDAGRIQPDVHRGPGQRERVQQNTPRERQVVTPAVPAQRQLPAVGDIFTGKVLNADETAVLVEVPGFNQSQVFGVIKVEPGVPKYRPHKDSARVEVIGVRKGRGGTTILELKRAPKQ